MFRVCILLAVLVAVTQANLDAEWAKFKQTHNKKYSNVKEESYRRLIWESHKDYIAAHNEGYKNGKFDFYLADNEYADMANEEFVSIMNGYKMRKEPVTGGRVVYEHVGDVNALPATVDWRPKGYVTPVKNQGECGSCWAFSTTGGLEGQHFKATGKLVSLSEQNLVDCSRAQGNFGCAGGDMDEAFYYIKVNKGIDTETSYPYTAVGGTCKFNRTNVGAYDTGFVDVKSEDETALQSAVATVGPISVAIDSSGTSFQLYGGGVYYSNSCSQTDLDHAVLVVGYGTYNSKAYWMVKNSWGVTWGLKGYIRMSRNRNNNCGIATEASYPTV